MAKLIAKPAFEGLLPASIGEVQVTEIDPGPVTFIQPLKGREQQVSASLKQAVGSEFPRPGAAMTTETVRLLWCGPNQALLLGATAQLDGAAVVDQTDGWAVVRLEGNDARDVLARLTPLDTRRDHFGPGQTARTLIGHMTGQITCTDEADFELMVFRSMAGTLVHDITRAARFVAGRARLGQTQ